MSNNYHKLLDLLKKWPIDSHKKSRDFGFHLRKLFENIDCNGNIFPGTTVDNIQITDSLMRLANNLYKNKYPVIRKTGATGMELKDLETVLSDKFIENLNNNKFRFSKYLP